MSNRVNDTVNLATEIPTSTIARYFLFDASFS